MPELNVIPYDENKGEWFPYQGVDNDNTRTRAMYFFHNSLGEAVSNVQIEFADQITIGGSDSDGSGSSWQGKASDIVSWPITDDSDSPIETYSDGLSCYFYRFRNSNIRMHIHHPPGWDSNLGDVENQTGVSLSDKEIYKRYVDALEFILDGNTTKSIRLVIDEQESDGSVTVQEMQIDVPLTYTDLNGNQRVCDGSYDQSLSGSSNNAGYNCSYTNNQLPPNQPESWLGKLGGAGDAAQGGAGFDTDGVWAWGGAAVWPVSDTSNNRNDGVGQLTFNRVDLDGGGGGNTTPETIDGFFMIDPEELGYQIGDYLLLEAADEENEFHSRVVFVSSVFTTSNGDIAYEIQLLDDIGFFNEDPEDFTITKLTNAPKLKIKYRIPDTTLNGSITVVDDEADVS